MMEDESYEKIREEATKEPEAKEPEAKPEPKAPRRCRKRSNTCSCIPQTRP